MNKEVLIDLNKRVASEITRNILPFWMTQAVDLENGGFIGQIDGHGNIISNTDKGGILNARILWTFSAAYNFLGKKEYLAMAEMSKEYSLCHFFDKKFKGTYWKITFDGKPSDTKKQIYSQAFFIYALAEYYKASGDINAINIAEELFRLIEEKSFDKKQNGYLEAFSREWNLLEDLRLSDKDANEKKTTNTHLHLLEAYTNLYNITKKPEVAERLWNLVNLFLDKIIDPESKHMLLFFDENWNSKSTLISYGHDIEASWLIIEAAVAVGDVGLVKKAKLLCMDLAKASLEGLQPDGSLIYEKDDKEGIFDTDRHWWPQAEAVVGLINLFELSGDEQYLNKAVACWDYIENNLIDHSKGEWYWSIHDGKPNLKDDKAGFWKCPYHNSRACLEVLNRTGKLLG
ncbi:MAG TPA: AGE family epimerase/isomerase [Bacteroidales bacterium]|jgi:mannobiose 2-epimerase|nr:AGE family epimerase/isomerase [Bacteroidales bacterium]